MECEIFSDRQKLYDICTGNSNLPRWKIDAYRIKMGLEPLFFEQIPENSSSAPEVFSGPKDPYSNLGNGPGTEMLLMYKEAGIPACQQCFDLAHKMNMWGPDKCEENIDAIIDDIMPRAKAWIDNKAPWISNLIPNFMKEGAVAIKIRSDVRESIKKSRDRNITVSIPAKNTTGCGCGG